jgi:hypothetical protein
LPDTARSDQRFCSGKCRTRSWVITDTDRHNATQKLKAIRGLLDDSEPSELRERIRSILDEGAS